MHGRLKNVGTGLGNITVPFEISRMCGFVVYLSVAWF